MRIGNGEDLSMVGEAVIAVAIIGRSLLDSKSLMKAP